MPGIVEPSENLIRAAKFLLTLSAQSSFSDGRQHPTREKIFLNLKFQKILNLIVLFSSIVENSNKNTFGLMLPVFLRIF